MVRAAQCIVSAGLLFIAVSHTYGQNRFYYRISSTQETCIVSLSLDGILTWSNAVTDAQCLLERASELRGPWSVTFPYSLIGSESNRIAAQLNIPQKPPYENDVPGSISVCFTVDATGSQIATLLTSYALTGHDYPTSLWWHVDVPVGEEFFWVTTFVTNAIVSQAEVDLYAQPTIERRALLSTRSCVPSASRHAVN
jgi:hypothetical protein